jgi:DNA-binding MarR family transcriptional regulator
MEVVFSQQGHFLSLTQEFGINPGSLKLLLSLDPEQPAPMSGLAEQMRCDASMVTWLVDRLEERGLVERKLSAADRRIKTVVLTREGADFRKRFETRLYEPPGAFKDLSADELESLTKTLGKVRAAQKPR